MMAVMSASDSEDGIGSYSFISDTGDSPPLFPSFPTGLPGALTNGQTTGKMLMLITKRWISQCQSLHGSRTHITGLARLLKMGKFAASPITYHAFVVKVFNKSADECRYAKKIIGTVQERS